MTWAAISLAVSASWGFSYNIFAGGTAVYKNHKQVENSMRVKNISQEGIL